MDKPTELPISPTRTAMTIGAITAALMLVVSAVGLQFIGWLVFVGGIYYGMKRFKKELGGIIVYFSALNAGFQTAFFASIILAFVVYVTTTLEPSLIAEMLDSMEQQLKTSGVSSGLVEIAVKQWNEILSPLVFAVITIFGYSLTGGLASLVCAFFVRNAKPGEFVKY